jgi:hypothetical protein
MTPAAQKRNDMTFIGVGGIDRAACRIRLVLQKILAAFQTTGNGASSHCSEPI